MRPREEQTRLIQELIGTAEAMGQAITPNAAALMVSDLEDVPMVVVQKALRDVRSKYKGRLTFGVIRERIEMSDGRPEGNEAWAIALAANDERESVVWTEEMALAFEDARTILQGGDKVGARMAFLSAYERFVQNARDMRKPAEWSLSAGWDGERRHLAIEKAVRLDRLPMPQALALGYEANRLAITADGQALMGLLAGPSNGRLLSITADDKTRAALQKDEAPLARGVTPEMRERLQALRRDVAEAGRQRAEQRAFERDARRKELQARKQEAAEAVQTYQSEATNG